MVLLDLYKRDFCFENQIELNSFIKEVIFIAEKYIYLLSIKGKIYLPFELSCYDAAVETVSELFKIEHNQLIKFSAFFEKTNCNIKCEDDILKSVKSFIYTIVQNNLPEIYKSSDPTTYKIIRNIKHAVKEKCYFITNLLSDVFIHKEEINFNGNYLQREQLLCKILPLFSIKLIDDTNDFIEQIFELLETQDDYIRAISLNDLVWLYKEIFLNSYSIGKFEHYTDVESKVYLKLLIEDTKTKHIWKTKKYITKQNISESEIEGMYNILDEVCNSLIAGEKIKSVRDLVDKNFDEDKGDHIYNKVEYFLQLFTNNLIEAMKRENLIMTNK